jgi:hypothetical protein
MKHLFIILLFTTYQSMGQWKQPDSNCLFVSYYIQGQKELPNAWKRTKRDSLKNSFVWVEKIDYTNGEKVFNSNPNNEQLVADGKLVVISGKTFAVDSTKIYTRENGDALIIYYCGRYLLRYNKESSHGDWAQWFEVKTRKLIYQFKSTNSM